MLKREREKMRKEKNLKKKIEKYIEDSIGYWMDLDEFQKNYTRYNFEFSYIIIN